MKHDTDFRRMTSEAASLTRIAAEIEGALAEWKAAIEEEGR